MKISKFSFVPLGGIIKTSIDPDELNINEQSFQNVDDLISEIIDYNVEENISQELPQLQTHLSITHEDFEVTKSLAYEEGYNKAKEEIKNYEIKQQEKISLILENLKQAIIINNEQTENANKDLIEKLSEFSFMLSKKLARINLTNNAEEYFKDLITNCFDLIKLESSLTITLNSSIDDIESKLSNFLNEKGINAKINFKNDPKLEEFEIKLEWKNSCAERNQEDLEEQVEKILKESGLLKKNKEQILQVKENLIQSIDIN